MKKITITIILLLAFGVVAGQVSKKVFGLVFDDTNANGKFDKGDLPIQGVPISTLDTIVLSAKNGGFLLPLKDKDIVFVLKPTNYEIPLLKNHIPDFYYLHNISMAGNAAIPRISASDTLFFPLRKSKVKEIYVAQMVGDPQIRTNAEMDYFREGTVTDLLKNPADFSVFLGDIADDELDIYHPFNETLKMLENPVYMVFGNHDVNYESKGIYNEAESFRSYFGPDYYSFNYGKTHYIVLNTVLYKGWNEKENKRGSYFGGIDSTQFKWLKQDLNLVGDDYRVVLLGHIPLLPEFTYSEDLQKVFSLLKSRKKLVSISGHLHGIRQWTYTEKEEWKGKSEFNGMVVGAACGSWWSGPYGEDHLPEATCTEGSPKGFFLFNMTNEKYNYQFVPTAKPVDFQLRISTPFQEVYENEIAKTSIVVNVFAAEQNANVMYSIDNGAFTPLSYKPDYDPFVLRTTETRKKSDWQPSPSICYHLWSAAMPLVLKSGIHKIEVKASLRDGKLYRSFSVFEIVTGK